MKKLLVFVNASALALVLMLGVAAPVLAAKNTFDITKIKVGDKVAGMRVVAKNPERGQVQFKGKVTLTGMVQERGAHNPLAGQVCMDNLDAASQVKLPKEKNDTRSLWFCFSNKAAVKKKLILKPDASPRKVTLTIDNYTVDLREAAVANTAKFVVLNKVFKETANLKTYHNDQYGFEFTYPASWSLVKELQPGPSDYRSNIVSSVGIYPTKNRQDYSASVDIYNVSLATVIQNHPFLKGKASVAKTLNGIPWSKVGDNNYVIEQSGKTYTIGGRVDVVNQILATFKFTPSPSSTASINPVSVADAAWGIPALPPGFDWQVSTKRPRDRVMGPQGKALDLPGKTYIHAYTDASAPKWDSGVFAYYVKALARDLWQHSVIDAKGREFTAPAADGMLSGSVVGELQIQNNTLRAIIYWNKNTSSKKCMEVPGEPPCPLQNYEQGVFISDPMPVNSIPGEAFKG